MRQCVICGVSIESRGPKATVCASKVCKNQRRRAHDKRRYEADPEAYKAKNKRYYAANSEARREYSRKYRSENADLVNERERKRRQANPEKKREQQRRRRAENPELFRAQSARARARNGARYEEARRARRVELRTKAAELDRILAMSPEELINFAINASQKD